MDGEKNVIRRTLRRVLLTGVEDNVTFGKRLVSYAHHPDGSVTARFEDGSCETGDILVGADGTSSAVRRQRLPQARLEETGIVSLGGKLLMTAQSKALLSEKMFYGMSLIIAPKVLGAIIHSLEFAQNRTSAAFAARWPHFIEALDQDSVGWALWGAAISSLAVRTSVPPPPWESSNVTLLGDAVHTMTPGRGAGANTALRDAALLGRLLIEADQGKRPRVQAIHDYEAEMLRYSSEAVIESRKQMNSTDMIHRPVLGRAQLAAMRGAMRVINAVPALKRRTLQNIMRVRGEN